VVLLLGRSNSVKTSLINLILDVFSGTVGCLDGDYLTGRQQLKKSDLMAVNNNRIIVGQDFEFGSTGINVGNIKDLTSGDPFSYDGLTYSIRTTTFNSCNKVPVPVPASMSVRPEMAKRFITISNKSLAVDEQMDTPHFTSEDKCKFIGECLLARMTSSQPPVTLAVFILTMYLGRYEDLSEAFDFLDIDYTLDMIQNGQSKYCYASSEDWMGMTALCLATSVSAETLIDAAYAMNKSLVFTIGRFKCIKGIRHKVSTPILFPPIESTLAGACWIPTAK